MKNIDKVVLQGSNIPSDMIPETWVWSCPRKKHKDLHLFLFFLQFPGSRNILAASTDYMENKTKTNYWTCWSMKLKNAILHNSYRIKKKRMKYTPASQRYQSPDTKHCSFLRHKMGINAETDLYTQQMNTNSQRLYFENTRTYDIPL
jgi:hypothetical protein